MADEVCISSLKLKQMPDNVLQLLSCLLNPQKIILAGSSNRVYRDWRGLAFCVQISAEEMSKIEQSEDKTARLMAIWMQQSPKATVGELLQHLEYIDRFDVRDDIVQELTIAAENDLLPDSLPDATPVPTSGLAGVSWQGYSDLLTDDDRPGFPKKYDALVLCADEDNGFFEDLLEQLDGFDICTPESLRVGLLTPHPHVAKLIAERCLRIIAVFSPAFLRSPCMQVYTDLAQALDIHTMRTKLYPIKYKPCVLPYHLFFCVALKFDPKRSDRCWRRIRNSLTAAREDSQYMQQQRSMSFDNQPSTSRGSQRIRPEASPVYNAAHYTRRRSDAQPSTSRAAQRIRPEESPVHNTANYNIDNAIFLPRGQTAPVFAK